MGGLGGSAKNRDDSIMARRRTEIPRADVTTYYQGGVGGNHIQVIRKDFHALPSFFDRQSSPLKREFPLKAGMTRIEILYEYVGHARIGRNARDKLGK
jgi:hypothetical protein